jgi:hypothetical protein
MPEDHVREIENGAYRVCNLIRDFIHTPKSRLSKPLFPARQPHRTDIYFVG